MSADEHNEILELSAIDLLRAYRRRQLSPVEVARAALDRIEATQPTVNAFCYFDRATTLGLAEKSEKRWSTGNPAGLLDGLPISVKDNLLVRDWPTLQGSMVIRPDQPWREDSPCAARIREHGGVFIGKTNLPEFCHKLVTDNPRSGITRNPWDTRKSPGGSSGGAAAAVAMGIGPLAVGSDGGASIRVPASWSGIFGMKPTFGRVPAYPAGTYAPLSYIGPMTRSVVDAALLLSVIAEHDDRDWTALPPDGRDYRIGLERGVEGMRIAWSPELGFPEVTIDPECLQIGQRAVTILAEHGAKIEQVNPPIANPQTEYRKIWKLLTAHALQQFSREEREMMDPAFIALGQGAETVSVLELHEAMELCGTLGTQMGLFHKSHDLLISMCTPGTAIDVETPLIETVKNSALTRPFNMTRQPAASVPVGLTAAGMPVGLQIVGAANDEPRVLRAALVIEQAIGRSKSKLPRVLAEQRNS
jgi:aspartyl-tRNA(Asn)/glutamyl-tRNA(Gln) amidotransferase subunit A